MGTIVSVSEAKARLSELLRRVREGETVLILSHGHPVARLEPVSPAAAGEDVRLAGLEERGVLRRGPGLQMADLADAAEWRLPSRSSLLQALIEDREEGR